MPRKMTPAQQGATQIHTLLRYFESTPLETAEIAYELVRRVIDERRKKRQVGKDAKPPLRAARPAIPAAAAASTAAAAPVLPPPAAIPAPPPNPLPTPATTATVPYVPRRQKGPQKKKGKKRTARPFAKAAASHSSAATSPGEVVEVEKLPPQHKPEDQADPPGPVDQILEW
jgi:hypothetical protein